MEAAETAYTVCGFLMFGGLLAIAFAPRLPASRRVAEGARRRRIRLIRVLAGVLIVMGFAGAGLVANLERRIAEQERAEAAQPRHKPRIKLN